MANKLTKSVGSTKAYSQGGALVTVLAFGTFLDNGVTRAATYTFNEDGSVATVALNASAKVVALSCEKDKVKPDFATQYGAGGKYIKQTLGLVLGGASQGKNNVAKSMDLEDHTYIVNDRRGRSWVYGIQNGLSSEKNDGGLGAASGDLNGYDIAVSGAENDRPLELSKAAMATLTAAIVVDAVSEVVTEPTP